MCSPESLHVKILMHIESRTEAGVRGGHAHNELLTVPAVGLCYRLPTHAYGGLV
jgi:hypothetical protein